ncbi:MAG: hypothetical protein KGO49_11930 [Gammaproteobacteria bacterium]|nr:hypothetical protein [Gammaproteobacteria bacterium]
MKNMNNNVFLVLVFALLSGCSTVKSDHTSQPVDQTLHPVDCTKNAKREECLAVANMDKKTQKKTAKSDQSESIDRRAKSTKAAESKKLSDDKAKAKSEVPPVAPVNAVESKPDLATQKKMDKDKRDKAFAESMDCVKNNIGAKDDIRSPVRAVAYDLAVLCRKTGVSVDSVANATIPLVSQTRVLKKTK